MSTVHIVPLRDLIDHEVPGGRGGHDEPSGWLAIEALPDPHQTVCACGPTLEHVPTPGGPDGWLITHASLDGREANE